MGVSFRRGVRAASASFGHGARSCGQTPLVISIAPMSSGRPRSRCTNIARATDWPVRSLRQFVGGTRSTRFAEYAEVGIIPS